MSTRGGIARVQDSMLGTWSGRYHHWDSNPEGLGATLYAAYHGYFQRDLEQMLKYLIDEHPAGWSTINGADFSQPPGFHEEGFKSEGPECYCHGGRSEDGWELTQANASESGVEWVYAFDVSAQRMLVLSSYRRDGVKMIGAFGCGDPNAVWVPVGEVDLDGPEPDWERLECGRELERCGHYAWHHFPELKEDRRYARLGTTAYLGYEPMEEYEAYGVEIDGTFYWRTGSGHREDPNAERRPGESYWVWTERRERVAAGFVRPKPCYWVEVLERTDGVKVSTRLFRYPASGKQKGQKVLMKGMRLLYPPTRDKRVPGL